MSYNSNYIIYDVDGKSIGSTDTLEDAQSMADDKDGYIIHSSIQFKIVAIYPSIEHPGKIAVVIAHLDGRQEVRYLESL